jgi:hypothetical protein
MVNAVVPATTSGTGTSMKRAGKPNTRAIYARAGAALTVVLMTVAGAANPAFADALPDGGSGTTPPGVGANVDTVVGWVAWIVFTIAILGLFFTAFKMMTAHHRGEGGQQTAGLLYVLGGTVVAAAASGLVGALA